MVGGPMESEQLGETERLLLERADSRRRGLVSELGKTVRDDGLDHIRAVVWSLYEVTNVVFPLLAAFMVFKFTLQLTGYGVVYYWDDVTTTTIFPTIHFDTLDHLQLLMS
jgi:hypothetical protein